MTPRWTLQPAAAPEVRERLCGALGLQPLVADILVRRGIDTPEAAQTFLQPRLADLHDPFSLLSMDRAVERIVHALQEGERIVVSGDYDVDGMTSTTLLTGFLRAAGAREPLYFIPNRFEHGYGLTGNSVDALLAMKPDLIITVDNGITAMKEVDRLNAAGVDTVITDHHLPRPEGIPAGIVVNPQQPGCPYPNKAISGCGLAFKLVMALRKQLRGLGWWNDQRPEPNLLDWLDLVAIATIADVVALTGENRVLVHHGLEVLNRNKRRVGVAALLNGTGKVVARTVGFQIAPRINAAGRMTEGALAVELLLSESEEQAAPLAQRLEAENDARRAKGESMFREAVAAVEEQSGEAPAGIVVASADFHEGIIGIVASRLVERYHKPVVVLAENGAGYKGSARSVPGVNVTDAIASAAPLLEEYGGHEGAAGCKFLREHLDEFRARFAKACGELAALADPPAVLLDGRLDHGTIDEALVEQVAALAPFGHKNEEPRFLLEPEKDAKGPEVLKEKHLKWKMPGGVEMIAWNKAREFDRGASWSYLVRLGFNEFRGRRTVQLTVEDMRDSP